MGQPAPDRLLRRLDVLVGEWEITVDLPVQIYRRAWTTFEWLEGRFLVQHADGELADGASPEWVADSPLPTTTIIGLDDASGEFCQFFADARGMFRIYRMSFDGGVWRLWRDAPGFHQRFTGTVVPGGAAIEATWERSADGIEWERDFDMVYTKVA
ncbi:hypothetical protein [Actinomadura sp. 6N118]|uniref:hypothetical protein n=1 Tax=Actinomadura sp. 6N118 TaxID=3375151 RepID=UPI0037BAFBD8